jgi:hypothetical protein
MQIFGADDWSIREMGWRHHRRKLKRGEGSLVLSSPGSPTPTTCGLGIPSHMGAMQVHQKCMDLWDLDLST